MDEQNPGKNNATHRHIGYRNPYTQEKHIVGKKGKGFSEETTLEDIPMHTDTWTRRKTKEQPPKGRTEAELEREDQ